MLISVFNTTCIMVKKILNAFSTHFLVMCNKCFLLFHFKSCIVLLAILPVILFFLICNNFIVNTKVQVIFIGFLNECSSSLCVINVSYSHFKWVLIFFRKVAFSMF